MASGDGAPVLRSGEEPQQAPEGPERVCLRPARSCLHTAGVPARPWRGTCCFRGTVTLACARRASDSGAQDPMGTRPWTGRRAALGTEVGAAGAGGLEVGSFRGTPRTVLCSSPAE